MSQDATGRETRPPLPRRAVLGALLCGGVVAAAVGLAGLGAAGRPSVEAFRFSRGVAFAPGEALRLRAHLADVAAEPRLAVRITGHTGTRGSAEANLALSERRAAAALEIARAVGLPEERIRFAGGLGGTRPTPRPGGMGEREHERALARVEIAAVPLR